jgi:hypothetical protein
VKDATFDGMDTRGTGSTLDGLRSLANSFAKLRGIKGPPGVTHRMEDASFRGQAPWTPPVRGDFVESG